MIGPRPHSRARGTLVARSRRFASQRFEGLRGVALSAAAVCLPLALSAPVFAAEASAQDNQAYEQAMRAWLRGDREMALDRFERILAGELSSEEAYALWQMGSEEMWNGMLLEGGESARIAKRVMKLATSARKERSNDVDAIRRLLAELDTEDPIQRRRAISRLRSDHGEFAVQAMLGALADEGNDERRLRYMVTLAELGSEGVLPLIAALDAPSDSLRRSVCLVLGNTRDPRARGFLAHHAQNDPSPAVREAALTSLDKLGGSGGRSAEEWLVEQGNAYLDGSVDVLSPGLGGRAVWSWSGGRLNGSVVPPTLYAEELAKRSFSAALGADGGSMDALGGMARAAAKQLVKAEDVRAAGDFDEDAVAGLETSSRLALALAGPDAADRGLNQALSRDDVSGAVGLLRFLSEAAVGMQPALRSALAHSHPQVRSEAALAATDASLRGGQELPSEVIDMLGASAGRDIVQVAVVIDPNRGRGSSVAAALRSRGLAVQTAETGARGLVTLGQVPGVDLVLLSSELPDLTVDQVLTEIQNAVATAGVPVWMLADDVGRATEFYGERTAGVGSGAEDLPVLEDLIVEGRNRDREQADQLSRRSAGALSRLAAAGIDVGGAADGLVNTLTGARPDAVAIPALDALARSAGMRHVPAIVGLVSDPARSEEARVAGASALSSVFRRNDTGAAEDLLGPLAEMLADDSLSGELRASVGRALGALDLDGPTRSGLLDALRAPANP